MSIRDSFPCIQSHRFRNHTQKHVDSLIVGKDCSFAGGAVEGDPEVSKVEAVVVAHHHQRPSKSFIVQQQLLSPASRLETFNMGTTVYNLFTCQHEHKKKQLAELHQQKAVIGQQTKKKNVYELIIFSRI